MELVGIAILVLAASVLYATGSLRGMLAPLSELAKLRLALLEEKREARGQLALAKKQLDELPGAAGGELWKDMRRNEEMATEELKEIREDLRDLG